MSPSAHVLPRSVRRSLAAGLPIALVAAIAVAGTATGAPGHAGGHGTAPRVTGTAVLGDIALGRFSNSLLKGSVVDDRGSTWAGSAATSSPQAARASSGR